MAARKPTNIKSVSGNPTLKLLDPIATIQRRLTRTPRHYNAKRATSEGALENWLAYTERAGFLAPYNVQVGTRRHRMAVFDSALYERINPEEN